MNILISSPSLDPTKNVSGISTVTISIIKYNKEHRYYHYLLGRPDKKTNNLLWGIMLIKQFLLFPFFIKKNKIKIAHQNLPLNAKGILREFVINCWCCLLRIPIVLQIHGGSFIADGTSNFIYKKLVQFIFQNSKQVIVLSEVEKTLLEEKFGYIKAIVLPNCIDTSIFKSDKKIQNYNKLNLLFLGRIEKNKGIYELIEALKKLKNEFDSEFDKDPQWKYFDSRYWVPDLSRNGGTLEVQSYNEERRAMVMKLKRMQLMRRNHGWFHDYKQELSKLQSACSEVDPQVNEGLLEKHL